MDYRKTVLRTIQNLPRTYKITAISTFIIGMLAYGYIYLNPIFIHDGSTLVLPYNFGGGADRLTPFCSVWFFLQGGVQLPWFAGIISLFLCGWAAFFVCDYLEIKHEWIIVFVSGIMITSPTLISSNAYGTGALSSVIALFFSSLSAWFCGKRTKNAYIFALVCLVLSVGTYVPYISWMICVVVIKQVIITIGEESVSFKEVIKKNAPIILIICSAIIIDILISLVIMMITHTHPQWRVNGLANMNAEVWSGSGLSKFAWALNELKNRLCDLLPPFISKNIAKSWGHYSIFNNNDFLSVVFWISWLFLIVCLYKELKTKKTFKTRILLLIFWGIILFFAKDLLAFVTLSHGLMQYAHISPWILLIAILDVLPYASVVRGLLKKITGGLVIGTSVLTILFSCLIANVGYMRDEAIYRSGLLAANRIAYRLESIYNYD